MAGADYTKPFGDINLRITTKGHNPVGTIGRTEQSYIEFCNFLKEQTERMIHGKTLLDKVNWENR